MFCSFDMVYAVTDDIGDFVSEVRRKHLIEKDGLAVIAFDGHADIGAGGDVSVECAFFMISDVHFYVDNSSRKAFVGKVSEKPEGAKENERDKD